MATPKTNILKCRYCAYTCARFVGKKPQQLKLFLHVIDEHEEEMKQLLGIAEDVGLEEYISKIEVQEERSFGFF